MKNYDLVVIGGGPAGMAAALAAQQNNIENILIMEREIELGGVLNQCIHNGFGLHHFKKELTGPEYSSLVIQEVQQTNIECMTNTTVLKIGTDQTVHAINSSHGYMKINAKAIVLAMGCRERTRGAIRIAGSRPAGVYAAGTAQRLVNVEGILPGKTVVILGSGDIGLLMARRLTLEGAKVVGVFEILPYSSGLIRNIAQCLNDFDIPLILKTTITKIHGQERVEGVTAAEVDASLTPIAATERFIPCDTVLLSVGLIPENEVSQEIEIELDPKTRGPIVGELRQTCKDGVFACGNVLQVHDVVDFVSAEGAIAGLGAAQYIKNQLAPGFTHTLVPTHGINYVIPQKINANNVTDTIKLFMRVNDIFEKSAVNVYLGNNIIASKKGLKFVPAEMLSFNLSKQSLLDNIETEIVVKVEPIK